MSKTRSKQHNESEHYRGQIRKLESENRQLKRRLKQLEKQSHFYEDLVDAVAEEIKIVEDKCKACGEGVLKFVDLKYAKFMVCDKCKKREKI